MLKNMITSRNTNKTETQSLHQSSYAKQRTKHPVVPSNGAMGACALMTPSLGQGYLHTKPLSLGAATETQPGKISP